MKRWSILIAMAVAALALVAAGCTAGGAGDDGGAAGAGGEAAPSPDEASGVAREGAAELVGDEAVASTGGGGGLPSLGPQVVQTATLRLSVAKDRFEATVDDARSLAAGLGGFVVSSSASQGPGTEKRLVSGSLVLRLPERSYAQAMEALTGLGRVEQREETGQDVSQELVDLEARARHFEAVERQLLHLLEQAKTVPAALAVQSRLEEVQLQLERARGRLRYLDDQVAFATISLQVRERIVAATPKDGGNGIVEAWRSAAHGFVTVVGWIFVGAATIAPVVLLLLVAFVMGRIARRTIPAWRRS